MFPARVHIWHGVRITMKIGQLKYGFLISITTMFGGSSAQLLAQTADGKAVPVESKEAYQKNFLMSIAPDKPTINVDFMVDSVDVRPSNGDLLTDVNVIQLLAYLDQDSDEYQSYMASRHIVAHELWHRICMMNDVLEKPMSASQYRNGRDNFEITASLVQLLTFRDDYIHASPEQRSQLHDMEDPKIRMYLLAVDSGIVNPLSQDKKDFDFEMEFIAKTVSGYWNANLAPVYAKRHNAMTEKSGRKEFSSPAYNKNFTEDIKKMNRIGGIDFSELYNYRDVRDIKLFEKGAAEDTAYLEQTPGAPNYEAWITQKSKLKRFSKQTVELPNFAGNRLAEERERRPYAQREQPLKILPLAIGQKIYPYMKVPFCAAVHMAGKDKEIKIYPHGAIDYISRPGADGKAKVKTVNYDGSYETGQLLRGREDGAFIYFDNKGKEISRCTFRRGRPVDGGRVLFFNGERVIYRYQDGMLRQMDISLENGTTKTVCTMEGGKPLSGMIPTGAERPFAAEKQFLLYQNGNLLATAAYDNNGTLRERRENNGRTLKIERFYASGQLKYAAQSALMPATHPVTGKQAADGKSMHFADALPAEGFDRPLSAKLSLPKAAFAAARPENAPQKQDVIPLSRAKAGFSVHPMPKAAFAAARSEKAPQKQDVIPLFRAKAGFSVHSMPKAAFSSARPENVPQKQDAPAAAQAKIKLDVQPAILPEQKFQTGAAPAPSTKEAHPGKAPLLRQKLYAPDGKPVLAVERENGHNKFKIKIKEFVAFLQKSPLPLPQQRVLVAGLTFGRNMPGNAATRSRPMTAQNADMQASKAMPGRSKADGAGTQTLSRAELIGQQNTGTEKIQRAPALPGRKAERNAAQAYAAPSAADNSPVSYSRAKPAPIRGISSAPKGRGKKQTSLSALKNKVRLLLAQRNRNGNSA